MKPPSYTRHNPKHLALGPSPEQVDVEAVAESVDYTGSAYHKDMPSFAGDRPRPRKPDANLCPRELATRREQLVQWLRHAIREGHYGSHWESGFPRYVWHREGTVVYEARLTNAGTGEYHGYPLEPYQTVKGLP